VTTSSPETGLAAWLGRALSWLDDMWRSALDEDEDDPDEDE
jgi:hypothetical protein